MDDLDAKVKRGEGIYILHYVGEALGKRGPQRRTRDDRKISPTKALPAVHVVGPKSKQSRHRWLDHL